MKCELILLSLLNAVFFLFFLNFKHAVLSVGI